MKTIFFPHIEYYDQKAYIKQTVKAKEHCKSSHFSPVLFSFIDSFQKIPKQQDSRKRRISILHFQLPFLTTHKQWQVVRGITIEGSILHISKGIKARNHFYISSQSYLVSYAFLLFSFNMLSQLENVIGIFKFST